MMTRLYIGRLGWLASIALLTAIVLLATRIDIATWTVRESALSERLAALVTCVLPAMADDPDTTFPDCETSAPDQVRAAWMTAC